MIYTFVRFGRAEFSRFVTRTMLLGIALVWRESRKPATLVVGARTA